MDYKKYFTNLLSYYKVHIQMNDQPYSEEILKQIEKYEHMLQNGEASKLNLISNKYFWLPALYAYKKQLKNNIMDDSLLEENELFRITNRLILEIKGS